MKNLFDPQILQELKTKPVDSKTVDEFLTVYPQASAGFVCKVIGLPPSTYYSWKNRQRKSEASKLLKNDQSLSDVSPSGAGKRRYSPEEKVTLIRDYQRLNEKDRGEFLRSYGLYYSDLERWLGVAEQAAIAALGKKKQGRIAKSPEHLRIEELEREIRGQEKVITRLSALVVIQKKVSSILGLPDPT
jgi:transposase-like protein